MTRIRLHVLRNVSVAKCLCFEILYDPPEDHMS